MNLQRDTAYRQVRFSQLPDTITPEYVGGMFDLTRRFGAFDPKRTDLFNLFLTAKAGLALRREVILNRKPIFWSSFSELLQHYTSVHGITPDKGTYFKAMMYFRRLAENTNKYLLHERLTRAEAVERRRWIKSEVIYFARDFKARGITTMSGIRGLEVQALLSLRAFQEAVDLFLDAIKELPPAAELRNEDMANAQALGRFIVIQTLNAGRPSAVAPLLGAMRERKDIFGSLGTWPAAVGAALSLAILENNVDACLELLKCLSEVRITHTDGNGEQVKQPLKVDLGSIMGVLNIASVNGSLQLAEEAWALLKRSAAIEPHLAVEGTPFAEALGGPRPANRRAIPLMAYHAYISALAKCGQIEKAFAALEEMYGTVAGQRIGPALSTRLSNRYIAPLINAISTGGEAAVDQAYFLLESKRQSGAPVTHASLNVIIAACGRIGDLNRAFLTFEALSKFGLAPAVSTFNTLMEACLENGHVRSVFKVVEEMQKAKLSPDGETHSAVIRTYLILNDPGRALEALNDMRRLGAEPSTPLLEEMIIKFARLGADRAVEKVKEELVARGYDFARLNSLHKLYNVEDASRFGIFGGMFLEAKQRAAAAQAAAAAATTETAEGARPARPRRFSNSGERRDSGDHEGQGQGAEGQERRNRYRDRDASQPRQQRADGPRERGERGYGRGGRASPRAPRDSDMSTQNLGEDIKA